MTARVGDSSPASASPLRVTPTRARRQQPGDLLFSVLGSGSSGNATYLETPRVRALLDAGLSYRETRKRLATVGRRLEEVDVVILSHEHHDHCRGLDQLTRRQRVAVLASAATLDAIGPRLAPGTESLELRPDKPLRERDLEIVGLALAHDAAGPLGYRLEHGRSSLGHVTDLGSIGPAVRDGLAGLHSLVLEANHDVDMVRDGPYPWSLKRRLLSPLGHLSNDAVGEFLAQADVRSLELLVLAHLSRTNNRPELARVTACAALDRRGSDARVTVAQHDRALALTATIGNGGQPAAWSVRPASQLTLPFDGSARGPQALASRSHQRR